MRWCFVIIVVMFIGCEPKQNQKTGTKTTRSSSRPPVDACESVQNKGTETKTALAPPRSLVDALASSNPATKGKWGEKLPPSWSEAENKRVWKAYREIVAKGKSIVPILIENLDRKEFSTCMSTSVEYSPFSVGHMCKMAIAEMFDPIRGMYKSRENGEGKILMGASYFSTEFYPTTKASIWWSKHQNKTPEKIRRMIYDWYINRERTFGFKDDKQKKWIIDEINNRFKRKKH